MARKRKSHCGLLQTLPEVANNRAKALNRGYVEFKGYLRI
jgi:hypothetical protein